MKKLFAILMSFQLILAPVAYSQQAATGIDNYMSTGDGSFEGNLKFVNSIMMTGSGVFGSLFMMCKKGVGMDSTPTLTPNTIPTFSHYLFMAGAVVLLLGEIVAATKQKERIKRAKEQVERMATATKPGEVETAENRDIQLKILWKALEEEEFNRDALEERINWMGAAEVVYWSAVAGAVTETILFAATKALMTTRTTARTAEYTALATETAACAGPQAIVACAPATAAYAAAVIAHQAAYAAEKAVGYYSQTLYNCVTPATKGVVLGVAAAYGVIGGLTKEAGKGSEVGGALMGGLTVVGTMLLLMKILTAFAPGLNVAMTTAPARVVIFGVFAALAETARNGYKDSLYRAKDNIAALKAAIQQWEQANLGGSNTAGSDGGTDGGADGGTGGGTTTGGAPNIATLPKVLPKFPKLGKCLSASGEHSEKSCRTPIKFNRSLVKFKSKFLSSVAGQAFNMSEAFARDDAASANKMAASMGNNAARTKAEAMALIKEANAKLVSSGEKAIDFDKEVKAQLANMSKSAMDSAGMSGASGAGGSRASLDDAEAKSDETSPSGKVAVAAPGAFGQPAPDLSLTGSEMFAPEAAVTEAAPQNLDDFESSVQDVATGRGASIFEQVSNRYILNLSKILVRKKKNEIVPVSDEPEK
jgi:hypothetical protein